MRYISVAEIAKKWQISERSVRNYCAQGKIEGAFLTGKTWNIPADAVKPDRINKKREERTLLSALLAEKRQGLRGGIYHKIQIELTYNSNHIEGSQLTQEQTRFIFETNTVGVTADGLRVDDIVETANHFSCFDYLLERVNAPLSHSFIKQLHRILKNGTSDSRVSWFAVGEYKRLPNEVGGRETALPEEVEAEMQRLIRTYESKRTHTLDELLDFHYRFERIHPFQDGNGRVGRLVLFKECLRNNIVPFVIDEDLKLFYYRGLSEWKNERGFLRDTCLTAQDKCKAWLDYFRIPYGE